MEEHKAVINELVNEFADSIENLEDKKELTIAFEKYLYNLVKMAEKIDSSIKDKNKAVEMLLRYSTDNAVELTLDQKRQMLIRDESFEKIRSISNRAFEMTQEVLAKKITEPNEQELEEMKNTLNQSLKDVKDFNKQQAVWLVSEGILDLNFVENPKIEIMSIRLGRRLHSK